MALNMSHTKLVTQTPMITGAMSAYQYDEGLRSLFKFKTSFEEEVEGSIRQGNTLWVPREAVPYAVQGQDFRVFDPTATAIDCTFVPRHEQGVLVEKSVALLKQGRSHIFEAPTGHGKTVEGGAIACALGQNTMIVVTKEDLMQQWYDALTKVLKVSPLLIGKCQGSVAQWWGKKIVLGMAQSLMIPDKYPEEMFKYFGLVILDEVHMMATDCFIRVCQSFYAKLRLGFSATPERKDGKTQLLRWHIGQTLVKGSIVAMQPKVLVRKTGWKIPRIMDRATGEIVPLPHAPGRMMLVNKAMASNDLRNLEIVKFTLQSYAKGRTTLILSDLKEYHLDRLFLALTKEGIPGNEIGYYVGGMKKHELDHTKTRKVVLGTYKMCSTGTDVPAWDTLVMATPRADVKQIIGRVLRWADGKRRPVVLDLVDYDAIFNSFHLSRVKQYYSVGGEVVKV